jgi:hypothetical protein
MIFSGVHSYISPVLTSADTSVHAEQVAKAAARLSLHLSQPNIVAEQLRSEFATIQRTHRSLQVLAHSLQPSTNSDSDNVMATGHPMTTSDEVSGSSASRESLSPEEETERWIHEYKTAAMQVEHTWLCHRGPVPLQLKRLCDHVATVLLHMLYPHAGGSGSYTAVSAVVQGGHLCASAAKIVHTVGAGV